MAHGSLTNKTRAWFAALSFTLFAVNAYVCLRLFRIEYLDQMGSIEPLFITLARYVRDNWRDLSWFPFWYNGIPFQNTYPPLLPMLVAGVSAASGASPALSYHATAGLLYCAGPVTLFWLCYRLSRKPGPSFFAGLLFSVVSSSAFLMPYVRRELGSAFHPRRLQTLVFYGEGPHVAGLALLALSVLLLDIAIDKRRPHWYVTAALAFAATALTNWLSAAALGFAVLAYLLARPTRRALLTAVAVALLAYAFAAPWIPPSTVRTFQINSQDVEGNYRQYAALLPVRALILAAALAILKYFLRAPRTLQFGVYFTAISGAIVLTWDYAGIAVVPQPHRYQLELEMGIAILVPFTFRAPRLVWVTALAAAAPLVVEQRRYARLIIRPVDMSRRIEYRSARWIDANLRGKRVLTPGSVMYWLNAFTDTAQLGGADAQGATNYQTRVAEYVIESSYMTGDRDLEISLTWLKAFGVDAIEAGGPKSGEFYKPIKNPAKFAGAIPELWRDGDDAIYAVPRGRASLAHVVRAADLPSRTPIHGLDIEPLKRYVEAIEDPSQPEAELRWTSRHSAQVRATVKPGQVISVQITYHPGWHATAPLRPDALGQMVIEPACDGPCTINLDYDGGTEMRVARALCWLALAGSAVWVVAGNYRGRRASN